MKYKLKGENDFIFGVVEQIGKNRGVENIDSLLSSSEKDTYYPYLLDNMTSAIDLVSKHLKKKSKVHIIVDSDCDGITSATIIYLYLQRVGFTNISWSNHPTKTHGIIPEELEDFKFDLLVVPDAGSNDITAHKIYNDLGIDILVLDHHDSDETSTDAVVINPKMCNYPNKEISGAVVVYKFCQAFDSEIGKDYAKDYLDLVALGVIADMMDTRVPETRYFCTEGLKKINNPMLKAIIEKQKFSMGEDVTIIGVQFYIAPLINAVFRSGTKEERDMMFEAFISPNNIYVDYKKRGVGVVKVSLQENSAREIGNIKVRQDKAKEKLMEPILEMAHSHRDEKIHILDVTNIENPQMFGLIANDMVKRTRRPVLIIKDDGEGFFKGSARNYDKFEIDNLKDFLSKFDFDYLRGHENAFGVSIKKEKLDSIVKEIGKATKDISVEDTFIVDFILNEKDLNKNFIKSIDNLKPLWGNSFEEPYILIKGITVSDVQINEKLTKMSWTGRSGIEFVVFRPSEYQMQQLLDKSVECDIIGRVGLNTWQGVTTNQVTIEDFQVVGKKEKELWF